MNVETLAGCEIVSFYHSPRIDEKSARLFRIKSQLWIENKLLSYKAILKLGVRLWSTASNLNIEIPQRFQNKYLRIIVNALWYVINDTLHHHFNVLYVRD